MRRRTTSADQGELVPWRVVSSGTRASIRRGFRRSPSESQARASPRRSRSGSRRRKRSRRAAPFLQCLAFARASRARNGSGLLTSFTREPRWVWIGLLSLIGCSEVLGLSEGDEPCEIDADCSRGNVCVAALCQAPSASSGSGAGAAPVDNHALAGGNAGRGGSQGKGGGSGSSGPGGVTGDGGVSGQPGSGGDGMSGEGGGGESGATSDGGSSGAGGTLGQGGGAPGGSSGAGGTAGSDGGTSGAGGTAGSDGGTSGAGGTAGSDGGTSGTGGSDGGTSGAGGTAGSDGGTSGAGGTAGSDGGTSGAGGTAGSDGGTSGAGGTGGAPPCLPYRCFAAQILKASNADVSDDFGLGVALEGDVLVVTAQDEDGDGTGVTTPTKPSGSHVESGAAYAFVRESDGWTQRNYLKAPTALLKIHFGFEVALDLPLLAVSSIADAGGSVHFFERTEAGYWTAGPSVKASNAEAGDEFGRVVALQGDTMVATAPNEDSDATGIDGIESNNLAPSSGAAYVFERSEGVWSKTTYLKASNTGMQDIFEGALSLTTGTRSRLVPAKEVARTRASTAWGRTTMRWSRVPCMSSSVTRRVGSRPPTSSRPTQSRGTSSAPQWPFPATRSWSELVSRTARTRAIRPTIRP